MTAIPAWSPHDAPVASWNRIDETRQFKRTVTRITMKETSMKTECEDQIQLLMRLVKETGVNVFREEKDSAATFATVPMENGTEVMPLLSRNFRRWLIRAAHMDNDEAVIALSSVKACVENLAADAQFGTQIHEVHIRVAYHDNTIYVDLCDEQRNVVAITAQGWQLCGECPVQFKRPAGMLSLPVPEPGGSLDELKSLLRIGDHNWTLLSSTMVGAFNPVGSQPVTIVVGPQASGKTLLCKVIRNMVDPHKTQLRSVSNSERDWIIAASNSWLMACDNLSSISAEQSDSFCRMSTGAGFGIRELYTNDQEFQAFLTRPILLNSIDELALREDLRSRMIQIVLPPLDPVNRVTEAELWQRFEQMRPRILGALFDAIAHALAHLPNVTLPSTGLPRLSDFTRFVIAASPAMGLQPDSFLNAYQRMEAESDAQILEDSSFGLPLIELMSSKREFEGTCSELLIALNERRDTRTIDVRQWPASARALSGRLRRMQENLLRQGIRVEFPPRQRDARMVRLTYVEPVAKRLTLSTDKSERRAS